MSDAIVLDASTALSVLRAEPAAPRVSALLRSHVTIGGRVIVPAHFWLEITNVLMGRYGHTATEVVERIRVLDEFEIQSVDLDRALWLLTVARADGFGLGAYDAAYLALAESLGAELMTFDERLAAAAGSRAIPLGPQRLAEVSAAYGGTGDLAARGGVEGGPEPGAILAQFGEYLAELRRPAVVE
ncbi:MAG TPA: type II toxin-antitoxin system VapC family toxin [Candidatus Saccharimonadales bacterium]|nr:type II toxin-antitoxin system VapC family toxin [Candidatus Saccharimonadales bacterium]